MQCLFVFTILSPFIELDKLTQIFQKNMLEDDKMLEEFKELLGYSSNKPFECVGTYEEVRYACTKTIKRMLNKNEKLPYLLQFY